MAGDPFYPFPSVPPWPCPPPMTIAGPRTMPVNVPFSNFGVTIVVLDRDGNLTIKVDQPHGT